MSVFYSVLDMYIANHLPEDIELQQFVKARTIHREKSHGYDHLYRVSRNAVHLSIHLPIETQRLALLVGWLHDLMDHKYLHDHYEQDIRHFLKQHGYSEEWILDIIERISYSREISNGTKDWYTTLNMHGVAIRHIVSDADKIDAIGLEGLERCKNYIREKNSYKTEEQIIRDMKLHAEQKLIRLAPEYIRTTRGKRMAQPLHEEMKRELIRLK